MLIEFNSIQLSTPKHAWNHIRRPEEHLCKKQSIIYIKYHTYILGLLKSSQNFDKIEH